MEGTKIAGTRAENDDWSGDSMTTETRPVGQLEARRPFPARLGPKGNLVYKLVTTTDHKLIGIMYMVACFVFFFIGGIMALFMRAELAAPGLQFLSNEQFNQLFTMHGTAMLLFYATPIVFGFANIVLPLQIGAPDVAFPRLNALSFWLFVFGAMIALAGFITPGGAADFGWTAYSPLTDAIHQSRRRWRPVDPRPGRRWSWHHPRRRQHDHHRGVHASAGHDDVPDADPHLEHPGDVDPGADGVSAADRGVVRSCRRPPSRRPYL